MASEYDVVVDDTCTTSLTFKVCVTRDAAFAACLSKSGVFTISNISNILAKLTLDERAWLGRYKEEIDFAPACNRALRDPEELAKAIRASYSLYMSQFKPRKA